MIAAAEHTTTATPSAAIAAERAIARIAAHENSILDALEAEVLAAEVIWNDLADLTDSVRAEKEGREVTAEDHATWNAASDRHWAAVDALVAYVPRNPAELLRKAKLLTNKGDTRLRTEEHFADVYLRDAEAMTAAASGRPFGLSDLRTAWAEALLRYNKSRDAYDVLSQRYDEMSQAITDRAPDWNRMARKVDGKLIILSTSLQQFLTDRRLKATRISEEDFLAWLATEKAALADLGEVAEQIDAAYDKVCDDERALIETPAPDLEAVILKQQMFGCEKDDDKRGYDDPAYYAAMRDHRYIVDAWPIFIFEDCLRLCGLVRPEMVIPPFRPRQWKVAFEAAGGRVDFHRETRTLDLSPPTFDGPIPALMAEIGADPANVEALRIYLEEI